MRPRVRIKYCGGCNPEYDRMALVADIKAQLKGVVAWSCADADPFDRVVAVHGCRTACADVTAYPQHKICHITSPEDAAAFISLMRENAPVRP
jgi:hypothetical protein